MQDRLTMNKVPGLSSAGLFSRWWLRLGKPLGLFLSATAALAVISLVMAAVLSRAPRASWPTEGYYFAGVQYQLALQALRLEIGRYHFTAGSQQQAGHLRDVGTVRDVLHNKFNTLNGSPEIRPFLDKVAGFRGALGSLTEMDRNLDALVDEALQDRQGFDRFNERVEPLEKTVVTMVNNLRDAELQAFQGADEADQRAAFISKLFGFALLALLGVGSVLYVKHRRQEFAAFLEEAEARAEAQRTAQARVALFGMVSHELRTPLQTMLGNIELLSLTVKDKEALPAIAGLQRSIEMVSGQLDNIANYTRLASGSDETRHQSFDLVSFLERVVQDHRANASANQQLNFVSAVSESLVVEGDPIRLQQILNNFISNALKYAGAGAITVSLEIDSASASASSTVTATATTPGTKGVCVIKVEDEGPGIADSELGLIWEPFVRGRRVAGKPKGSGLGLAVVKLLAGSAGWDVGVSNEGRRSTAFFVRFPLMQSNVSVASNKCSLEHNLIVNIANTSAET